MTRHLTKFLDAIWTLSMGLFLGLTGGLVLSVIMTFRGARALDAKPGVEPYSDPMFASFHNEAIAGHIGQNLFAVGLVVALLLLNLAAVSWVIKSFITAKYTATAVGSKSLGWVRGIALLACAILTVGSSRVASSMNNQWESLYDLDAEQAQLDERRDEFDQLHKNSERLMSSAWFSGFLALVISPWCRRPADVPLQSGDGKEESDQEEDAAEKA